MATDYCSVYICKNYGLGNPATTFVSPPHPCSYASLSLTPVVPRLWRLCAAWWPHLLWWRRLLRGRHASSERIQRRRPSQPSEQVSSGTPPHSSSTGSVTPPHAPEQAGGGAPSYPPSSGGSAPPKPPSNGSGGAPPKPMSADPVEDGSGDPRWQRA